MDTHEPVIYFKYYRITNIDYKVFESEEELKPFDQNNGKMSIVTGITDDYSDAKLAIQHTVIDKKQLRVATVEITGFFTINKEADKEKISDFLRVNGTAILFPYLRTVVSFITSLDNEKAIILPTINTTGYTE